MMAVAIGVAWAGYALGIWGYCLVRGYDVPFTGVFKSTWPGGGQVTPPASSNPTGSGAPVILA